LPLGPGALGSVFGAGSGAADRHQADAGADRRLFPAGFQTVSAIAESGGRLRQAATHPGVREHLCDGRRHHRQIERQADQQLKAGQSFQIPEGAKHDACTTGGMKVLAVYIVEKGKPLASPAP
jgi:hypothetical protein